MRGAFTGPIAIDEGLRIKIMNPIWLNEGLY